VNQLAGEDQLKLKNNPDSTNLSQAIKEYDIPARHEVDGVKVPLSPVLLIDAAGDTARPTVIWDSLPMKVGLTADPAAGAQIADIVVPAGKRWRVFEIQATLVASAAVANRYYTLQMYLDGVNASFVGLNGLVITASQTRVQSWMANSGLQTAGTEYGLSYPDIEIPAGGLIRLVISALDGGDNSSAATYYYKEAPA